MHEETNEAKVAVPIKWESEGMAGAVEDEEEAEVAVKRGCEKEHVLGAVAELRLCNVSCDFSKVSSRYPICCTE